MIKPKLIVITGTTATGKTKRALKLAKALNGEVLSADSRQVYKQLDVITGKDFQEKNWCKLESLHNFDIGYYTINSVPVWLYDVLDPKQHFSAYDWCECAQVVLRRLKKQNKVPIIVGGSYFYIQSLLYGLNASGTGADWPRRGTLSLLSIDELRTKLQALDQAVFLNLNHSDQNNKHRLIRWIEKFETKTRSRTPATNLAVVYTLSLIGLRYGDKAKLRQAIAQRINQRLKQGALAEVELLLRMGYNQGDPGLQTLGYKQLLGHFLGELSLAEAEELWLIKEMQYAKRQLVFMAKNPAIAWEIL